MPDPVTYVFHLREDVYWQNVAPVDGRLLVAQDLVYSYQRQRTDGWPNAGLLQAVDEMEAVDDHTLRIALKYPDADFLLALADGHSKIVAKEVVELQGDLGKGPVIGSGPWIWTSTEPGVGTFLKRNPSYFEEGLPKLDELRIIVIRDAETRYAVFATRTADVYPVPNGFLGRLEEETPSAILARSQLGGAGLLLAMNVSAEPFSDVDVRRAVFKSLDPWTDIDPVWDGLGYVGLGLPVVEPDWLLPSNELRAHFNDSDEGRAMLEGIKTSHILAFELVLANYDDTHLQHGRRVQEALRSIGFDPKARQVNPRTFSTETWADRDYQMLLGPLPPASTPNGYLFALLHSRGRWNVTGHSDDVLDGLIEAQAVEMDVEKRGDLLRQIQRHLLDQAYLFVPVTEASVWAAWPRVKDFHPNDALSEYSFWAEVSVEE
jgi:peptide/nickel transport system substrate-binding protein